jgi:hypothetical protein
MFGKKLIKGEEQTEQESDVLNFLVGMITDNDFEQKQIHKSEKSDNVSENTVHIIPKLQALKSLLVDMEKVQEEQEKICIKNMLRLSLNPNFSIR